MRTGLRDAYLDLDLHPKFSRRRLMNKLISLLTSTIFLLMLFATWLNGAATFRPLAILRSAFDKVASTFVLVLAQLVRQNRIAFRADRTSEQFHVGLFGRAAALADIALQTGCHNVTPVRLAALTAWHHVIETQIARPETVAAVLAMIFVAEKHIPPRKLHRIPGDSVVSQ